MRSARYRASALNAVKNGISSVEPATGTVLGLPSHLAQKAEALHLADRTFEALQVINEAAAHLAGALQCVDPCSFAVSQWSFWRAKACSETKFLKLGDQSAFVTGGRSKPNHNNNVSKPQKKEHKPMLTIRGEVTWQRDAETGEWKIRSAAEDHRAAQAT